MQDHIMKFISYLAEKFIFLRKTSAFIFYPLFSIGIFVRAYFGDVSFSLTVENLVFIAYAFMIIPVSAFFGWLIERRIQKQKEAKEKEKEELEKKKQKQKNANKIKKQKQKDAEEREKQEQKGAEEREKQEQENKKQQEFIQKIESIVKNLTKKQLDFIKCMLNDNDKEHTKIMRDKEAVEFKKFLLGLSRSGLGIHDVSGLYIKFTIYDNKWKILMELYLNKPKLFER